MSTFDNPFDPDRRLDRTGCACGRASQPGRARAMRSGSCSARAVESEEQRYEGVVASAVMRAVFPQDAARRAFLKSVGASTALAALSQFFPAQDRDRGVRAGRRDREEGPQGRLHPDHLRHADHHGASDGLLQQARTERRGDQDRRLGGHPRQDAQQGIRRRPHALADAARDHARRRLQPDSLHHAGGREHQRPGDHARRSSTRTSAIRSRGRASSSRCRSTTPCTIICCATTSPSTASIPIPTSRSARCRRRRWWPTCAPTTSTAFSVPIRSTSARSMTASASSTCCRRRCGRAIRAARSRRRRSSSRRCRTPTRRC